MSKVKLRKNDSLSVAENKPKKTTAQNEEGPNLREIVRVKSNADGMFLFIVLLLLCCGTVIIFSASYAYAKNTLNDTYYYLKNQIKFVLIGLIIMAIVSRIDYLVIKKFSYIIFAFVMVLMIATAIPGIGASHHGARRWLEIGPISFQPSELMKLAVILGFSRYVTDMKDKMRTPIIGVCIPFAVLGITALVMLKQNHLSGLIIIAALMIAMLFIGGCSKLQLTIASIVSAIAAGIYILIKKGKSLNPDSNFRIGRIIAWLNPESDSLNDGWQTLQSLYAISNGGIFGVGIGESKQKNLYLPEPQNDFVFSIWCEELGFVGAIIIIGMFVLFVWRALKIASTNYNPYASLVVTGITIKVALQALLNIAVVTNTIPNTGISLPFFSYGGTSLLFLMVEMGIVLSVSRYSYLEKG